MILHGAKPDLNRTCVGQVPFDSKGGQAATGNKSPSTIWLARHPFGYRAHYCLCCRGRDGFGTRAAQVSRGGEGA